MLTDRWKEFEAWLDRHTEEFEGALREGASKKLIDATQTALGVTFPPELREFYQCHDGQDPDSPGLFDGFSFLSLTEMLGEREIQNDLDQQVESFLLDSAPPPSIRPASWRPGWIPFASNGCGDLICVDLDPTEDGRPGQVIGVWLTPPERTLEAPSIDAWFDDYVQKVLRGEYHFCEDVNGLVEIEED